MYIYIYIRNIYIYASAYKTYPIRSPFTEVLILKRWHPTPRSTPLGGPSLVSWPQRRRRFSRSMFETLGVESLMRFYRGYRRNRYENINIYNYIFIYIYTDNAIYLDDLVQKILLGESFQALFDRQASNGDGINPARHILLEKSVFDWPLLPEEHSPGTPSIHQAVETKLEAVAEQKKVFILFFGRCCLHSISELIPLSRRSTKSYFFWCDSTAFHHHLSTS